MQLRKLWQLALIALLQRRVLSNVTMENECNFYGSGVGETSEASMDVRPRPYSFGTK